jgi:hypothetical protein
MCDTCVQLFDHFGVMKKYGGTATPPADDAGAAAAAEGEIGMSDTLHGGDTSVVELRGWNAPVVVSCFKDQNKNIVTSELRQPPLRITSGAAAFIISGATVPQRVCQDAQNPGCPAYALNRMGYMLLAQSWESAQPKQEAQLTRLFLRILICCT